MVKGYSEGEDSFLGLLQDSAPILHAIVRSMKHFLEAAVDLFCNKHRKPNGKSR